MATPENQPATAGLTAEEPFVSAHGRATVVVALFVAYIAVALFAVAVNLFMLTTDPVVLAAASEGDPEQLTLNDLLQLLVGLAAFVVYLALVVAFLLWLYRASRNVPALGNPKSAVEYSPGWAVGSFFVPFVNLVVPYKAVREVWEKSDPAIRSEDDIRFTPPSSTPLLLGWWLTWLATNVLSNITWRLHSETATPDTLRFVAGIEIAADLIGVVSAALAVIVVRGIDRRQAERARHVSYAGGAPPPPPVFTQPTPPQQQGT